MALDVQTRASFQREIRRQAQNVLMAVEDMNELLPRISDRSGEAPRFWYSIEAALSALGKISDILWPGQDRKGSHARARECRARFGIPDESVMQSRDARNGMEHFAERIDRWHRESGTRSQVDSMIGSSSSIIGIAPSDFARAYDPITGIVSIFGASINLREAVREVVRLIEIVPDPDTSEALAAAWEEFSAKS